MDPQRSLVGRCVQNTSRASRAFTYEQHDLTNRSNAIISNLHLVHILINSKHNQHPCLTNDSFNVPHLSAPFLSFHENSISFLLQYLRLSQLSSLASQPSAPMGTLHQSIDMLARLSSTLNALAFPHLYGIFESSTVHSSV